MGRRLANGREEGVGPLKIIGKRPKRRDLQGGAFIDCPQQLKLLSSSEPYNIHKCDTADQLMCEP